MKARSKTSSRTAVLEAEIDVASLRDAESPVGTDLIADPEEQPLVQTDAPSRALAAPAATGGRSPEARAAYPLAVIASLLWIGGVSAYAAYEIGRGQFLLDPVNGALLALVALAPVGLVVLVAYLMRQTAALAGEIQRARLMADNLGLPTGIAVQESGQMLLGLQADIDQSARAAETARTELAALRAAMEEETRRLNEAADLAQRTARRLTEQLSREREGMSELCGRLETQTQGVVDTIERQARMVADASDLAQTQLREAEATLTARAADMANAASEAQDAARAAADDLSRQTMRLETAGSGVADQIRSVEEGLSEQRAALVQSAFGLRRDQEDFAAQVETQRAQLTESLALARMASSEMGEHSVQGVTALQDLLEAATDQVRALAEMSQTEGHAFDTRTREALDRFEDLAAQARETAVQESERTLAELRAALETARQTTDTVVASARDRFDSLGEMAFEAGKAADQAAEARLNAARRVVEETAAMGEDAAQRIAGRLEENLLEVRAALAHIDDAVRQIDERAAKLPSEAKARVEEVKSAVQASLDTLSDATRRAAAETQAVDDAFQERVKRNYEMLTEAVQLMGVVSGEAAPSGRRASPPPFEPQPIDPDPAPGGRLRLTPTSRDQEVRRAFEPAASSAPAETSAMSWKELLASADEAEEAPMIDRRAAPPPAAEVLFADLTAGIREMGIDPTALLPRTRVEEAAQALESGAPERAREIVRRVAPAAVRRISRRVMTDRQLRSDVEHFVARYSDRVAESLGYAEGDGTAQLLGSEAGRTYLLLDAAVGDLAG